MGSRTTAELLDVEAAQSLSHRLAGVLASGDAAEDLFTDDAFFDLNMPVWRFQIRGPKALADQLREIHRGDVSIAISRTEPTASGFVQEHVESELVDGELFSARRLVLATARDGRIAELVIYCSGEWDQALRDRHAVEAPMIRA